MHFIFYVFLTQIKSRNHCKVREVKTPRQWSQVVEVACSQRVIVALVASQRVIVALVASQRVKLGLQPWRP